MKRGWLAALFVLAVVGCNSDPYVEDCLERLESRLKAPATLQVVRTNHKEQEESSWSPEKRREARREGKVVIAPSGATRDEVIYGHVVTIVYDAQNSFGALLRGKLICEYSETQRPGSHLIPARMTD